MTGLGRALIFAGLLMMLAGLLLLAAGRLHLPLGRFPGDLRWRGKNSAIYFPFTTCLLLSVLLSLVLYLLGRFRH